MHGEDEISRGRAGQEILGKKGLNAGKSVKGMEMTKKENARGRRLSRKLERALFSLSLSF